VGRSTTDNSAASRFRVWPAIDNVDAGKNGDRSVAGPGPYVTPPKPVRHGRQIHPGVLLVDDVRHGMDLRGTEVGLPISLRGQVLDRHRIGVVEGHLRDPEGRQLEGHLATDSPNTDDDRVQGGEFLGRDEVALADIAVSERRVIGIHVDGP
jgi:hypothetical protein